MADILSELKELDKILKGIETKLATYEGTRNAKVEELQKFGFSTIEESQEWLKEAKKDLEKRKNDRDDKFNKLKDEIEW